MFKGTEIGAITMNRILRGTALVLFVVGAAIGFGFNGIAVWADLEAFLFDAAISAESSLGSLSCPIFMNSQEQARISGAISNPLDQEITRGVRFRVTQGSIALIREDSAKFDLQQGESRRFGWTITPSDAAWDRLVLARVFVYRSYPLPSKSSACGIAVVDSTQISGEALTWLLSVSTAIGLLLGLGLWQAAEGPQRGQSRSARNFMFALAGLLLGSLVANLLGWWMFAGLLFLLSAAAVLTGAAQLASGVGA